MLKVIVDRQRWYRGHGAAVSRLLIVYPSHKEDIGKMCCLGFACLAAGLKPEQIAGKGVPTDISGPLPKAFEAVTDGYCGLVGTNDRHGMDEELRERDIKRLGLQVGLDFEFIN